LKLKKFDKFYIPQFNRIHSTDSPQRKQVVRNAICEPPHVKYPATSLHQLKNAVFYLTKGAAKHLEGRKVLELRYKSEITVEDYEAILVPLCQKVGKRLVDLGEEDVGMDGEGRIDSIW
jgi:hypothetical protein